MNLEVDGHDGMESASDQPGNSWAGQSSTAPKQSSASIPQGLAPTDLASLPVASRELVTWLARRKTASSEEIEQALNKDRDSISNTLDGLKNKGYIEEMRIEGVRFYRVIFHAKPRRGPRGLGKDLWEQLDLDGGKSPQK